MTTEELTRGSYAVDVEVTATASVDLAEVGYGHLIRALRQCAANIEADANGDSFLLRHMSRRARLLLADLDRRINRIESGQAATKESAL